MFYVSEISRSAPAEYKNELQKKVYETLEKLAIPYERVDTDEAITMEDCTAIDEKLDMKMVKTLFLCNKQQTAFYLFITCGDKKFQSKKFSAQLDIARVSFAPSEAMRHMLGTVIGAATVFSALTDTDKRVQIVLDRDVLREKFYGCSDGTTTGYMKVETRMITDVFLPYTGHSAAVIEM